MAIDTKTAICVHFKNKWSNFTLFNDSEILPANKAIVLNVINEININRPPNM